MEAIEVMNLTTVIFYSLILVYIVEIQISSTKGNNMSNVLYDLSHINNKPYHAARFVICH